MSKTTEIEPVALTNVTGGARVYCDRSSEGYRNPQPCSLETAGDLWEYTKWALKETFTLEGGTY